MTSHTHTQRPLVSDINSETWRLARTARAAQELRDYALYGPQPPPSSAPAPAFTGPYYLSSPSFSPVGSRLPRPCVIS
jgi:hypothetical protein